MSKAVLVVLVVAGAFGIWYFYNNYEIQRQQDQLIIKPLATQSADEPPTAEQQSDRPPVDRQRNRIRIASFNLGFLDRNKLSKRHVAGHLASLARRFDILAVQDIHARNQEVLVGLVEQINCPGRHYDFATSPSVGRDPVEQYSAFLFDRASVEIDRRTVSTVVDPDGRLSRKPLVASFRVRGPDAAEAFTFTLVNVHTDPDRIAVELELLDNVFRAVRDDGRNEDDIILLGDLGADDRYLGRLAEPLNITCSISGVPSTTRGNRLSDNILFNRRATIEFTGRSGVVDLMRELNLSMQQALEISDHLPVWAEFSVYEGGQAGHVASRPKISPPKDGINR